MILVCTLCLNSKNEYIYISLGENALPTMSTKQKVHHLKIIKKFKEPSI